MNKARIKSIVPNKNWWITLITPLGLALVTIITYWPSLRYAFQFDDEPSILRFYDIRNKTLGNLFFTSSRWVSYWLNTIHYKLGLFKPFVYRRSNVLFHSCSGILLYIVVLLLLRLRPKTSFVHKQAPLIAGILSALFLLHPVQTQTVSYVIQGQLEGLSALFSLLIILAFIFLATAQKHITKIILTLTTIALCALSCGTKEITIVLPFLIPLIDWFFIAQGNWHDMKKRWWIYATITATIWGCYVWLLGKHFLLAVLSLNIEHTNTIGNVLTETAGQKITAWSFFISQFKVILHYLYMFLWPSSICIDYDWHLCSGFDSTDCLLPLLVLLLIFASIFWALKKDRINLYSFGMLWFFICLSPRSTIMPSTELVADYKTYLASIGWLLVITMVLINLYQWLMNKVPLFKKKWVIGVLMGCGLLSLSFATYTRNKVWRSGLEFWADVVRKAPGKARGYNNYGVHLLEKGETQQAIWAFKRAIQIEPTTYPDPHNNIAAAYAIADRLDLAIEAIKQSLKINPYQFKAYNNMGIFLMKKGAFDWAEKAFLQAISLYPHYGKGYFNLGRLYITQRKNEQAWDCFKKACTIADYDSNPQGLLAYAQCSMELKKFEDAIHAYQLLAQFEQLLPEDSLNLADAYAVTKQYAQAIELYEQLTRVPACAVHAHHNLCEIYCRQKRYPEALEVIQRLEQKQLSYPDMMLKKAECLSQLGKNAQARTLLQNFIQNTHDNGLRLLAQSALTKLGH